MASIHVVQFVLGCILKSYKAPIKHSVLHYKHTFKLAVMGLKGKQVLTMDIDSVSLLQIINFK